MSNDSVSRRDMLAISAALLASDRAVAAPASASPSPEAGSMPAPLLVDRAFLRLTEGLVHYRSAGSRTGGTALPLFLAHAGPGSSSAFEGYLPTLGRRRFCFAPDMLGNGDSAPPASESVPITYYSECAVRVMDALGVEQVDFYGSHTGAQIGIEIAAAHPTRIRRLILDGLPLFPPEFKAQLLARYAPAVKPDDYGGHLAWAWNFARDQSLYWPYFERQAANRLANGVPSAELLHRGVTDILKALGTYHIAYHAAFAQDVPPVLRRVRCPVLLMASDHDPLSTYLDEAARLLPAAQKVRLGREVTASDRVELIEHFLAG
jgi:pimeloyl-ACP methyl ester carboxylesterase